MGCKESNQTIKITTWHTFIQRAITDTGYLLGDIVFELKLNLTYGWWYNFNVQCSPFIAPCLRSIGMNYVISESCYKGTILQRNYKKMTSLGAKA